jgi:cellulose biosynthesis protein BcsQ
MYIVHNYKFEIMPEATVERPKGKIVTFHSFEGGVGKTTMASRVGGLLANEGMRVALVDFDLNAPGLSVLLEDKTTRNSKGISGFYSDTWAAKATPATLEPYFAPVPAEHWRLEDGSVLGKLDLMPAYDVKSDDPGGSRPETIRLLETIRREDTDAANKLAVTAVLSKALRTGYDFALLDLSAGYNNISGLAMRAMADLTVVLLRPGAQGIGGTRQILPQLQSLYTEAPVPRVVVASQVPGDYRTQELNEKLGLSADEVVQSMPLDYALIENDSPFLRNPLGGLNPETVRSYQSMTRKLLALG